MDWICSAVWLSAVFKGVSAGATVVWLIEKEIAEEQEVMINSLEEAERNLFYGFYVGEIVKKEVKKNRNIDKKTVGILVKIPTVLL